MKGQNSGELTNQSVMPAKAGIHKLLILNADNKLDSGLRRNDEFWGSNDWLFEL